jgi:hypothetical protein
MVGLAGHAHGTLVLQKIDITGGTATQSTNYDQNRYLAPDAIDGDRSNFAHTKVGDPNPWWQVDFGTNHSFNQVDLYNRTSNQERLSDITVEVLNGGAPVYTSPVLNPGNTLNGPPVITLDLGSTYTGNVLKVSRDPNSTIGGQGILSLAEVEIGVLGNVMLPSGTNLTHAGIQNMTVAQSSNYNATFVASVGVDGVYNNFTHTAVADANTWWQVDFGETMSLESMTMFNRTNCCGERLRDITVEVLDSAGNPIFTSALLNPGNTLGFSGGGSGQDLSYDFLAANGGNPILGQTVRISRTADSTGGTGTADANVLSLAEVDIIGASAVPEPSSTVLLALFSGLGLLARRRR